MVVRFKSYAQTRASYVDKMGETQQQQQQQQNFIILQSN